MGKPQPRPKRQKLPVVELSLNNNDQRVEFATLDALTAEDQQEGFYT